MEERLENLGNIMPMTDEDFDDEIDELFWHWAGGLLQKGETTMKIKGKLNDLPPVARWNKTQIFRNKEVFQKLRLFKPLALKHPGVVYHTMLPDVGSVEDKTMAINPSALAQIESLAGFTYEDWAKETNGLKYDNWLSFKEGDLVEGQVMAFNDRGAFIEIGDKTWAFIPTENCSLAPIAHPDEVLEIGDQITAEVIHLKMESKVDGESDARQKVLSLTRMQNQVAWDEIDSVLRAEKGTSNIFKVMVKQMRPFGAIVQTERGLEGYVANQHLADKVGDSSIVGTYIEVELLRADRSKSDVRATRPNDFALTFSYANAATRKIAESLEEGQVVTAIVKEMTLTQLNVDVLGCRCSIRKIDISGSAKTYQIADLFELGEEIKVYVISVLEKTGAIRLSLRALEYKKGVLLTNKAGVFDRAEETAKKYFENAKGVKQGIEKTLAALGDLGDGDVAPKKKSGSIDIESGLDGDF